MLGDDFLNCTEEARVRAQSIVKNEEINRIGKIGKSFRPIVNDYWGTGQADAFMHRVADTLYVAAYHFTTSPTQKVFNLKYSDLGLAEGVVYTVHELRTDKKEMTDKTANILTLKVPRSDARVFKIYPGTISSVEEAVADKDTKIYPNPCHDELYINKLNNENNCDYDVYSIAGEKLISLDDFGGDVIDVNPLAPGSYILVSTDTVTRNRFVASFIKE